MDGSLVEVLRRLREWQCLESTRRVLALAERTFGPANADRESPPAASCHNCGQPRPTALHRCTLRDAAWGVGFIIGGRP